ncbi:MAG: signal peptidase I [Bacilli bacterium]|nr:signal peptidase I [Bacilli bacterium]
MKKNAKIIYVCELILFIYLILFAVLINVVSPFFKSVSTIVILVVILALLIAFFGMSKDKNYLRGTSTRIVISGLMAFFLIIYALGILLGFNKGYIYNDFFTLMKNIIFIISFTVLLELIRYLIAKNSFQNGRLIFVFTILSAILNILLEINMGVLSTYEDKFIFLSKVIFPVVAGEALCSFMTVKTGMLPSVVYKLVMNLYIYILPIVPDLGNYIYSVANILLPFILYSVLNRIIVHYDKEKEQLRKINLVVFVTPLIILFLILVALVSGIFKHRIIAVASNSMAPTYRRGDAIIYEKVDVSNLEVGHILAFKREGLIITHRITKIWKQNGKYYFTTKGDNNKDVDLYTPKEEDVLGRVRMTFKLIGYPTVIINEYFGKE